MTCEQANQIDLVEFLYAIGFQPKRIRGADFWYDSPFRNEKVASFKVHRTRNVWFDHGMGKGGKMVDFAQEYYHSDVKGALQFVALTRPQPFSGKNLFQGETVPEEASGERPVRILSVLQPIQSPVLQCYLKYRNINREVANAFTYEVLCQIGTKTTPFHVLGFKNNAGGYELRSEHIKICSSPKYITFLDHLSDQMAVFEGFFDFLSYQCLFQDQPESGFSFLILNSLAFFEKSLTVMDGYRCVHLFLDQDKAGRKCTALAVQHSSRYQDQSRLYNGYKDLNEWMMHFGKREKKGDLRYRTYCNF